MRQRWTWNAAVGAITALTLSALAPAEAWAQGAGSQPGAQAGGPREQARALANKGVSLFEAGQYPEAIEAFREAEKLFHAPTILLMVARANDKLGRLLEARGVYTQIVDEPLANYAPPEFFEAQATAKAELTALLKRIPRVEIIVSGAGPAGAEITLDGAPTQAGQAVPRDPGIHTVVVSVPGREPVLRTVTLKEGAQERVVVDLAAALPPADPPPPPGGVEPAGPRKGPMLPALVAFGVGGLGLGVGAVTGLLTLGKVGDLEKNCPGQVCSKTEESRYNSAHTLATVSTVGFVIAGLGAAAGAVLLVVRPGGDAAPAQTGVLVGPGWVGARGSF